MDEQAAEEMEFLMDSSVQCVPFVTQEMNTPLSKPINIIAKWRRSAPVWKETNLTLRFSNQKGVTCMVKTLKRRLMRLLLSQSAWNLRRRSRIIQHWTNRSSYKKRNLEKLQQGSGSCREEIIERNLWQKLPTGSLLKLNAQKSADYHKHNVKQCWVSP